MASKVLDLVLPPAWADGEEHRPEVVAKDQKERQDSQTEDQDGYGDLHEQGQTLDGGRDELVDGTAKVLQRLEDHSRDGDGDCLRRWKRADEMTWGNYDVDGWK